MRARTAAPKREDLAAPGGRQSRLVVIGENSERLLDRRDPSPLSSRPGGRPVRVTFPFMTNGTNGKLIADAFAAWEHGDHGPFFEIVADDVTWTVIGSTPISGTYQGKQAFLDGAVGRIHDALAGPIRARVLHVFEDGDHVILQWVGESSMRSGEPYHQVYCWVMRLDGGMIVESTAYLDTELVTRALGGG